jgi:transposase
VQPSLSEVGLDPTRFGSAKQFASWLGLCRGNNRSGGKRHGSKTRKVVNRAANAAGIAAMAAGQSDSAIGGVFRQLKARLGAPKAITATAHKIARTLTSGGPLVSPTRMQGRSPTNSSIVSVNSSL